MTAEPELSGQGARRRVQGQEPDGHASASCSRSGCSWRCRRPSRPARPACSTSNLDVRSPLFQLLTASAKLSILVGYMLLIRRLPEIYRVFQYHGAEHKSIYTYESGAELTVENARTPHHAAPALRHDLHRDGRAGLDPGVQLPRPVLAAARASASWATTCCSSC